MDAGVPITDMVAGISIGLIQEGKRRALITDILGEEDHFGDMDFKVCGTRKGITAIQLDIKIEGLDHDTIRETLHRARAARMKILDIMEGVIDKPREAISQWAPRLLTTHINPEKIGKLIGPGGKNIKKLQEDTGAKVDIEEDGTVYISSVDGAGAERCRDIIEAMMAEVKVGKIYAGVVVSIKDFGAFVEIAPDTDGLCHVSELSDKYVERTTDVVDVGDEIRVKVLLVDDQGRIKLSRKAAMQEEGQTDKTGDESDNPPARENRDQGGEGGNRREGNRDGGSRDGGRGGDRGGNRGRSRGGDRGGDRRDRD
jgi:polyribonucleotide nucleotidyltransferase